MKKNILVFPCGSEIGLEVFRSLDKSTHFNLFGASSVTDHGMYVYQNYIGGLPFINEDNFIHYLKEVVNNHKIDIIFPTMDSVITKLKKYEDELGCLVIGSPFETTEICLSKSKTYETLKNIVKTPKIYLQTEIKSFPVFCKPNIGYGSRGTALINNKEELYVHLSKFPESLILEYLPGKEYTIDCFTNKKGEMLFCAPRIRCRILNGISVNTKPVEENKEIFIEFAKRINANLRFQGAWFIQVKENAKSDLVLLEVASRLGGSSSLFRGKGVNFAQLSVFDILDFDVEVLENEYPIEMDRALDNKFKIDFDYNEVFIDYDDTIILNEQYYNIDVIQFLYQCRNEGIKITIISSHDGDLLSNIKYFKLDSLFDRIIHLTKNNNKANYIDNTNSIFIDDSFSERKKVSQMGIPVFSLDMVKFLIK